MPDDTTCDPFCESNHEVNDAYSRLASRWRDRGWLTYRTAGHHGGLVVPEDKKALVGPLPHLTRLHVPLSGGYDECGDTCGLVFALVGSWYRDPEARPNRGAMVAGFVRAYPAGYSFKMPPGWRGPLTRQCEYFAGGEA